MKNINGVGVAVSLKLRKDVIKKKKMAAGAEIELKQKPTIVYLYA